ncbi:hypothetical protein [Ruegeria sp.]|uniref:hypothetical protein n=1 Tax=Ruegeria sp. TaxID=1879320 RepID=UPI00231C1BF7|nr:hypothetical protein [Ruegeria sp.]MDA7966231.1 hypothetical protein [Ruegeria sp.]
MENAGYSSKDLHLYDKHLHDNRSVPKDQIHWDSGSRQVNYRAEYAASFLGEGEFCVGHLSRQRTLTRVEAYNVHVLNIVRDPITRLWSAFKFQRAKVKPTPYSQLWRTMAPDDDFKGFLLLRSKFQLKHSETLMSSGPFFCFEDLKQGKFIERALDPSIIKHRSAAMAQQRAQVIRDVEAGLAEALGKKTATYVPTSESGRAPILEDSAVTAFFDECGLTAASEFYRTNVLSDKTIVPR